MIALLGITIIKRDYKITRIRIVFHAIEEKFEVLNPIIQKSKEWISDVSELFTLDIHLLNLVDDFQRRNPEINGNEIFNPFDRLIKISNNVAGIIELSTELDIETVTKIFIRVTSQGTQL